MVGTIRNCYLFGYLKKKGTIDWSERENLIVRDGKMWMHGSSTYPVEVGGH